MRGWVRGGVLAMAVGCGPRVRPPATAPARTVAPVGAPAQARAAYLAGRLALERGELGPAEAAFDEAAAFDPGAAAIALAQAQARLQAGDGAGAGERWASAMERGASLPARDLARMVAWQGLSGPASAAATALCERACAAGRSAAVAATIEALAGVGVDTVAARDRLRRCPTESPVTPAG
jgi:hypothetical protein